jgi:hypothetical protein
MPYATIPYVDLESISLYMDFLSRFQFNWEDIIVKEMIENCSGRFYRLTSSSTPSASLWVHQSNQTYTQLVIPHTPLPNFIGTLIYEYGQRQAVPTTVPTSKPNSAPAQNPAPAPATNPNAFINEEAGNEYMFRPISPISSDSSEYTEDEWDLFFDEVIRACRDATHSSRRG